MKKGDTTKVREYYEERPGEPVHMMDVASELGLSREQIAAILTRQIRNSMTGLRATGKGYYMFDPSSVSDNPSPGQSHDFYYVGKSADGYQLYADKASKTVYAMVPVKADVTAEAAPRE